MVLVMTGCSHGSARELGRGMVAAAIVAPIAYTGHTVYELGQVDRNASKAPMWKDWACVAGASAVAALVGTVVMLASDEHPLAPKDGEDRIRRIEETLKMTPIQPVAAPAPASQPSSQPAAAQPAKKEEIIERPW